MFLLKIINNNNNIIIIINLTFILRISIGISRENTRVE